MKEIPNAVIAFLAGGLSVVGTGGHGGRKGVKGTDGRSCSTRVRVERVRSGVHFSSRMLKKRMLDRYWAKEATYKRHYSLSRETGVKSSQSTARKPLHSIYVLFSMFMSY